MKKQHKPWGITALIALMVITAACDLGMGMVEKPPVPKETIDGEQPSGDSVTTYTITFDKNGGDTEANPKTRTVTSPATTVGTLPTPPTRAGYAFDGWYRAANGSGPAFTGSTRVTGNITVYAKWIDAASASSNANIRAVSGDGANALYGFYMAGMPGISNGEPQATAEGFTDTTETMMVNYTLARLDRSIVVIVEDEKVSKVEFGQNDGANSVNSEPPSSWTSLTRNDTYTEYPTVPKQVFMCG